MTYMRSGTYEGPSGPFHNELGSLDVIRLESIAASSGRNRFIRLGISYRPRCGLSALAVLL